MLLLLLILITFSDFLLDSIPNGFLLICSLLGLFLHWLQGNAKGILLSIISMGTAFLLLYPLYKIRALGAGDVKAFIAIGSFINPMEIVGVIFSSLLFGAVLSLMKMAAEKSVRVTLQRIRRLIFGVLTTGTLDIFEENAEDVKVCRQKNKIHFTIAILLGTTWRLGGYF